MFPKSSQAMHWMFEGVEAVGVLRTRTHQAYLDRSPSYPPPSPAPLHLHLTQAR